MLIEVSYTRSYLFSALEETPRLLEALVGSMSEDQADARVDPDRFTLREAIAHLADWDTVFLDRMRRIVDEEEPVLPNIDEGQRCVDRDYASSSWRDELMLFRTRRAQTVAYLKSLSHDSWTRRGNRPEIGVITLFELVILMPLHDLYHLKQAREYLQSP